MAAIDDLIAQIEDKVLRERLMVETNRITKDKKFGLVFEDHLPELTPIYSAQVKKNSKVALRDGNLVDLWRVLFVKDGEAHCRNIGSGVTRQIPVDNLVVVRQFGEPIFPALVPMDKVQNGPVDTPWHTLIEADNHHALQLLEYLYAGKVDCIYIDPPYNTGARDWKYNNDYVDTNDRWRHSKWLAMMRRRLSLARILLHPKKGVLIVTIDEHEVHHLGMLLEEMFPSAFRQMVTIVITPGGVTQGRFARVEEYAFYCFNEEASPAFSKDDLLSQEVAVNNASSETFWQSLIRRGVNARREDRPGMFYPIFIDPDRKKIVSIGEPLPRGELPDYSEAAKGKVAWPIRSDGSLGRWRIGPSSCKSFLKSGFLKLGGYDKKRQTWTVLYLQRNTLSDIESGTIEITGKDEESGAVELAYTEGYGKLKPIKTVWNRSLHHAGSHGSTLLRNILRDSNKFAFPKSIYSTKDAIAAIVRDRPQALIIDFFAGSGTTLHSINLLNAIDGGKRRCILVTNNEVSEDEARYLSNKEGLRPGDSAWEAQGVCRSVAWPRSKYTILGQRDDGSVLEGEYLSGETVAKEKPRKFQQISFTSIHDLHTAAKKKQLIALIEDIPQSEVKKDSAFVVSEAHSTSILFDESQADIWLEALEGQEHITDFYIVTASKTVFDDLKARIHNLLGPMVVVEEKRRPMRDGFPANLEYFRLDFLDKDHVALGRQFREILPILWLRAGAIGPRPELPKNKQLPVMVIPEHNPFAILVNETRFADFVAELEGRSDLTHAYVVTDSEEAFQEMAGQLIVPNVIQLYRDYLENFVINKGEGSS